MSYSIKRAAVLGSGVMGSGIAALLANNGIPTLLLDIVPSKLSNEEEKKGLTLNDKMVRNRISTQNKKALLRQSPSPITTKDSLYLIEPGNMTDDMNKLQEVDWIIEVVVEDLTVKQKVLKDVDRYRKEGTIVSSNTSGISIEDMSSGCSEDFRKHFLGTHFFNPPRYLKLLEMIPTRDTDIDVLNFMKQFGENQLGKGVAEAKDTPNFIANRIGIYGFLVIVKEMLKSGYSIGEVDSITGTMIGRPKSATFRTSDVVGLDTFIMAANTVYDKVEGDEKEIYKIPDFILKMLDEKWIGEKSGQGFYRKEKDESGSTIYELNPNTLEYEDRKKLKTQATEAAKQFRDPGKKIHSLVNAKGDKAGDFIWSVIKPVLIYSADLLGEIADDIVSIDEAMRWGFGWELGPFEIWDAIGVEESVERMKADGSEVPDWVIKFLDEGHRSFYITENNQPYYYHHGEYQQKDFNKKEINLGRLKTINGVIKKNTGASLVDLGDGIAGIELHSQNDAIGPDVIQMVNHAIDEANENYEGLVIGGESNNFAIGANLAMMLMEAQDDNYLELEMFVKMFQDMAMKIKYSSKPIVVAPFNMTLGGGAEIALPAASIQASTETYMGLVEFGVGLIPGGGGTKELYLKMIRNLPKGIDFNLLNVANDVFEKVATAKVSTSAAELFDIGYLDQSDQVSVNPDHLLYDAKQSVITLARSGYQAPKREKIPVVGDAGYGGMILGAKNLYFSGYASKHDLKIAEKLAYVLSGGRINEGSLIDEQAMLDMEREAFLSLIGEPLTQQRMQHMLVKGKPLRN